MNGFGFGWGMGIGWLIPLVLIGVIYMLFQNKNENDKPTTAQDILDKRYASGGISKEEYEEKSYHLKKHS